jgi:predicted GTPase
MSRWRLYCIVLLITAPLIILIGLGAYYVWVSHQWWIWWLLLGLLAIGYFLAWFWTRRNSQLPSGETPVPSYWTDQDRQAWDKVLTKAQEYENVSWEDLSTAEHYTALALDLSREVARVYHPDIEDPFDPLTLPEVLTCLELAASDLQEWVQKYVPASHLIRIGDIRRARRVWEWYQRGQNAYWLLAALFDPLPTAARYTVTRGVLGPLFHRVRQNLIIWFHTLFIHRLGHYLIELQSGRLKVGSRRYRELRTQHVRLDSHPSQRFTPGVGSPPASPEGTTPPFTPIPTETPSETPDSTPASLTVVIAGPQGAGKTHLITTWAEEIEGDKHPVHEAREPRHGEEPKRADSPQRTLTTATGEILQLVEAPGFGTDPQAIDLQEAATTIAQADMVLLVTSAVSPGRHWEVQWLQKYREFFASRPHLRRPPLLVVVTHVDLLPPVSEWPPSDNGSSVPGKKEAAIRECVEFVAEQLGIDAMAVIPVGLRPGQVWGIREHLWPAVIYQLNAAHSAALLRRVYTEVETERWQKVGQQFQHLIDSAWNRLRKLWNKPS